MFMDLGLANRSVIVTGSGSNIGRAIALAFAKEGAKVAVVDIDAIRCEKVGEEARTAGASAILAVRTDVTDWPDVQRMIRRVETQWGQVDVLVNNVGWTHDRLFMDKPRDEWEKEIQLNLWSNINCTRAVLDGMLERSAGSIVNIGSDAGRMGEFREAVYGATKAGVIALAKSLSREIGPKGVRFNTVCPGTTMPDSDDEIGENSIWAKDMRDWNTPAMRERIAKAYPLRRIGRPEDIANAVLFMASDVSSFITGQTLSVSGGYTMM
jgi:2-hydroxycyclohexanecarboxyl-CoA dehydrogenase